MSNSTLKRTRNWFTVEGYVSEKCSFVKGIGRAPMAIEHGYEMDEYEDGEKTGRKIKCDRLLGAVTIRTQNGTFEIGVNATSKNNKGEDSNRWEMYRKIAEDWNPEIGGNGEAASYVTMSGSVRNRDYVGKDNKAHSQLSYDASSRCEHAKEDFDNSGLTLNAVCYLDKMTPEMRKKGDEVVETGRYKIGAYGVDYRGQLFPLNFVADEDAAEVITDEFEVGSTINVSLDRFITVIERQRKGHTFKKSAIQMNSGYTIDELLVTYIEEIPEPEEDTVEDEDGNEVPVETDWMNPAVVKKALKVRKAALEELEKSGNAKPASGGSTLKNKKTAAKSKKRQVIEDDEDELDPDELDNPFDDDDDDEF